MDKEWLRCLNSATKYPSIPTYHGIDPKNGKLTSSVMWFGDGPVLLTEKVDGTNGRVIVMPDGDWFIGSREEILYARGDRIENPNLGIVPALVDLAPELARDYDEAHVCAYYLEVYGRGVGPNGKQYASVPGLTGYRLFDVALVPPQILGKPVEEIASWRDRGGQTYLPEDGFLIRARHKGVSVVPRLNWVGADELPLTLGDTHEMLQRELKLSSARLDPDAPGRPEGIVLRTPDRSVIAKARFQDYERTLAPPQKGRS